jgi:Transposase IS66 family
MARHRKTRIPPIHCMRMFGCSPWARPRQGRCNIDETGWKEAGKQRWLWTMVTAIATFFVILTSCDGPGLRHLLGITYHGIVGSDRHRPYLALAPAPSTVLEPSEPQFPGAGRSGQAAGVWGADFLALSCLAFRLWHLFRIGTIDRPVLQAAMAPLQAALHARLAQWARRCDAPKGRCQALLAHEDALWMFVREEGVEHTNNAAAQALRTRSGRRAHLSYSPPRLRSMRRIARARVGHPYARCDSLVAAPAMSANDLMSFVRPIDQSPTSCYSLTRDDHRTESCR